MDLIKAKLAQIDLLKQKKEMQKQLPHLYSYKWYPWAKEFFESRNRINLLCSANQVSKSSTQIRKCIHWATSPTMWEKLWSTRPRQFWYLYPSRDVVGSEFHKKWLPEFMPRDEMVNHPLYGWKLRSKGGYPHEIVFNSGVSVYFKTYSQDTQHLQSGTVHAIFTDEEMPVSLFDELMFRLTAVDGYFHMVFTATMGQDFWFRALERIGKRDEVLKDALKIQVSMYECLVYEDGTPTPWTPTKIDRIKNQCRSEAEVQRRVYGRFVVDEGRKYPCFEKDKNVCGVRAIPKDWLIYTGVDIGGGGAAHPAAICFVAVRPDYKKGAIFKGWRGNIKEVTTASDILEKYRLLRGNLRPVQQFYDYGSKDFHTYASRLGETFLKAEKGHTIGEDIINVLFKNKMLDIFDIPELHDLVYELLTLTHDKDKRFARDDFVDAMRYAVTGVPWDWSAIMDELVVSEKKKEENLSETEKRRKFVFGDDIREEEEFRIEQEIGEYNELYDF